MIYPSDNAFPTQGNAASGELEGGLTKREYFAAMAMQGLLANSGDEVPKVGSMVGWNFESIAAHAICVADNLIAELNKEK